LDIKQLFAVTTMDRMLQHHVYEYEKLVNYRFKACSIAFGTHVEQSTTILDLKGVSLSGFSSVFSLVKQVSAISQNYYPEMLGKMFIINSPMLFTGCWALVKPILDEATVKKIDILGSNYTSKLLEYISLILHHLCRSWRLFLLFRRVMKRQREPRHLLIHGTKFL
jgi:hypothetical protein